MIERFIKLWQLKQFTLFVQAPMPSPSIQLQQPNDTTPEPEPMKKHKIYDTSYLFSIILSPVMVYAQQTNARISFEKLADLITMLIKNSLMTLPFLNEQCMKLLHIEWEQVIIIDLLFQFSNFIFPIFLFFTLSSVV